MTTLTVPSNFRSAEGYQQLNNLYDLLLSKWGTPVETRHVPTRFGQAYVVISGKVDAPPLVLIHGAGVSSGMWQTNAACLSEHFRLHALDIPGESGRSDPVYLNRRGTDHAFWLLDVLDALKLDKPNLAGISLGGWLVLQFASLMPQRVNRLVPLCPGMLLNIGMGFVLRGLLAAVFPSRRTVNWLMRYISAPGSRVDEATLDAMLLVFKSLRLNTTLMSPLTDDMLRAVTVPTLVMVGDHEVIYPAQKALERAKRLIPDCETVLIPGSGHGINLEQPDIMQREMIRFLLAD